MKLIETGSWQAFGALRGMQREEEGREEGEVYRSLLYQGRNYSIHLNMGESLSICRKNLKKERLYLVDPVFSKKKPYQLLKANFGALRASELATFPRLLQRLYENIPKVRQVLDSDHNKLLQEDFSEKLFGKSPYDPKMEDDPDTALPFTFLSYLIDFVIESLDYEDKAAVWNVVHSFNRGLGDTLFHPSVNRPSIYLGGGKSTKKEYLLSQKTGFVKVLSFWLTGLSQTEDFYLNEKGGLRNGEFFFAGAWNPCKKNRFKCFLSINTNLSGKKIVPVFLDKGDPQIKKKRLLGAVAKLDAFNNCLKVKEVLERYEQMSDPLDIREFV